jgi:CHASE2 domain-containing sensor protein
MPTPVDLVVFAVIGLFGTNAVPHFVKGVMGERHMTPLGPESSAVANAVWGSVNALVAGSLAWVYRDAVEPTTLVVAFVAGTAMAVGLASYGGE